MPKVSMFCSSAMLHAAAFSGSECLYVSQHDSFVTAADY